MNTVRYIDLAYLELGEPAIVMCLDHPSRHVSPKHWARTSPVKSIQYRSKYVVEFWTHNTHYVPANNDPLPETEKQHETDARE